MPAHRRPPGRPKGAPNKVGAKMKEILSNVFEDMGGKTRLLRYANKHPDFFYSKLWIKLMPAVLPEAPTPPAPEVHVHLDLGKLSDDDIRRYRDAIRTLDDLESRASSDGQGTRPSNGETLAGGLGGNGHQR